MGVANSLQPAVGVVSVCRPVRQVVFIPSYLLLAVYCLLLVAYACYLALLHRLRLGSSPQDLQTRRVADGIKIVSAVGVAVGITLFLVSSMSPLYSCETTPLLSPGPAHQPAGRPPLCPLPCRLRTPLPYPPLPPSQHSC